MTRTDSPLFIPDTAQVVLRSSQVASIVDQKIAGLQVPMDDTSLLDSREGLVGSTRRSSV